MHPLKDRSHVAGAQRQVGTRGPEDFKQNRRKINTRRCQNDRGQKSEEHSLNSEPSCAGSVSGAQGVCDQGGDADGKALPTARMRKKMGKDNESAARAWVEISPAQ
jgi:hypothetical protein